MYSNNACFKLMLENTLHTYQEQVFYISRIDTSITTYSNNMTIIFQNVCSTNLIDEKESLEVHEKNLVKVS